MFPTTPDKKLYNIFVKLGYTGTEKEFYSLFRYREPMKTINGESLNGTGDIAVSGGGNSYFPSGW